MPASIPQKISQSLKAADGLYHRLVLLVGESGSGKTRELRKIASSLALPLVNLNLALSEKLLELTPKRRTLKLPSLLEEIMEERQSPTVLDNIEILFDRSLNQDPLRLLEQLSRRRTILASWNGSIQSGRLSYADADHPEFRRYDTVDALIVGMDGFATLENDAKGAQA